MIVNKEALLFIWNQSTMKKLFVSLVLGLFIAQFLLSPYSYAQSAQAGTQYQSYTNMMDTFLSYNLNNANAFEVVQVAAYLYLYTMDIDPDEDELAAMQGINYFLLSQAPNIGFLADQEWVDENFFYQKSLEWAQNYPQEFEQVRAFAQQIQDDNTWTSSTQQPVQASTQSQVQPQNDNLSAQCNALYSRLLGEYDRLMQIPNVDYARIARVKDQIYIIESQWSCDQVNITRTQTQTLDQHVVEQVKQWVSFQPNSNVRVIPENADRAYCQEADGILFRQGLNQMPVDRLQSMHSSLDTLLHQPEIQSSAIKTNVVSYALQELWMASASQLLQQGNGSEAFHNFAQSIMLLGNNIINARWINNIMSIIENSMHILPEMFVHIDGVFAGMQWIQAHNGAHYYWDQAQQTFVEQEATDGTLSFFFPSADPQSNNVRFTIATARLRSISRANPLNIQTQRSGELTLEQFAQQAKNNDLQRWLSIDARSLGQRLTEQVIAFAPQFYETHDTNRPIIFVADANGEKRLFLDYNLTTPLPAGRFPVQRWEVYVVGEDGLLLSKEFDDQVPEQMKVSISMDNRIVAGVELDITYNQDLWEQGESLPQEIQVQLYLADYLIRAQLALEDGISYNTVRAGLFINGPSICDFSVVLTVNYDDDGSWLPMFEWPETNLRDAALNIQYNEQSIQVEVPDIFTLIDQIVPLVEDEEQTWELDIGSLINIINNNITAQYRFANILVGTIMPDEEIMLAIQYGDDSKESVLEVFMQYLGIINPDAIMWFLAMFMEVEQEGEHGWEYHIQQTQTYEQESHTVAMVDQELQMSSYNYDEQTNILAVSYRYMDQYGNVTDIHPDSVLLSVSTTQWVEQHAFTNEEDNIYAMDLSYVLTMPELLYASLEAVYTAGGEVLTDSYQVIEQQAAEQEAAATSPYTVQVASTIYPELDIQELVFSLYDNESFVSYVTPTLQFVKTIGYDCEQEICDQSVENIHPTYLDDVPTYIVDIIWLDNEDVFAAQVTWTYVDNYDYSHHIAMPIK